MSFNVGERVRVTGTTFGVGDSFTKKWTGKEFDVIERPEDQGHYYDDATYLDRTGRPDGVDDHDFWWPTDQLELVLSVKVNDLRKAVDALRNDGYTVEVKATEPPVPGKEIVL